MSDRQHYDPRLGDEPPHIAIPPSHEIHLKFKQQTPPSHRIPLTTRITKYFLGYFSWIPPNLTWSKLKPVIRCAVICWVSALFMLIERTGKLMGSASFLVLIASFLDTAHDPFIAVLEREVIFLTLVCIAWAWSCLGMFLANLARTNVDYFPKPADVLAARYVEAGPTVVLALFVFLGSAFFLYLKARMGPGPYIFATVFSCICIDISMTTQVLYPYPFYLIGQAIVVPLAFHCALSIFFSAILFPTTISARYCQTVIGVLDPLNNFLVQHRAVLAQDPSSDRFKETVNQIQGALRKSEGGLGPTAMTQRLLKQDIVYGRFSPASMTEFQISIRRLVTRADGMVVFFSLINPTRERFPVTPLPSQPGTPRGGTPRGQTPSSTRPGTPRVSVMPLNGSTIEHLARRRNVPQYTSPRTSGTFSRYLHSHLTHHKEERHDHHLHFSLLSLAHGLAPHHGSSQSPETVVGVFESQRYMAMEATRFRDRHDYTDQFVNLLHESCDELLEMSQEVLKGVQTWFSQVRSGSFGRRKTIERIRAERLEKLEALSSRAKEVWTRFLKEKRLRVLDPYRRAFDPNHLNVDGPDPPPHRYLFQCFMYQYHLLRFSGILREILDNIITLEQREKPKLWWPKEPFRRILLWGTSWTSVDGVHEEGEDEDPNIIQGIDPQWAQDLGLTGRRDPDALPPTNAFQWFMHELHNLLVSLVHGNALFALKAGVLSVILCLPNFLRKTAHFAYAEKFVWGIFMGQLTLARFRGDTTFGLFARIISTTIGGILGMVMWYISAGSGKGNAYGLAAVIGVSSPFIFFGRLYLPVPPMTNIICFVTAGLVIGYSWQNNHTISPFNYQGWNLAWRRLVLVVCGVVAAFVFSILPPSTTLRKYQRTMMSTTVAELGAVYCLIVSFANTREHPEVSRAEITQSLAAIRLKLKRSVVLKTNIIYEFSLRGRWPSERFQKILDYQLQISNLLSHLMSVVEHLEPAWSRAFLRRTRFLDADFQGDVLAVISMISTALRTGNPLPQITPCPLLDRFMIHTHGLNVIRQEADDDYGLPRTMTIDTLANEQYLAFSVGVTTAFGIVLRLDKLMVATKELVGEQYHIHGIGVSEGRPAKDA